MHRFYWGVAIVVLICFGWEILVVVCCIIAVVILVGVILEVNVEAGLEFEWFVFVVVVGCLGVGFGRGNIEAGDSIVVQRGFEEAGFFVQGGFDFVIGICGGREGVQLDGWI